MRLRDHLIAAGLALVVMALSFTIGHTDSPDSAQEPGTLVAADLEAP